MRTSLRARTLAAPSPSVTVSTPPGSGLGASGKRAVTRPAGPCRPAAIWQRAAPGTGGSFALLSSEHLQRRWRARDALRTGLPPRQGRGAHRDHRGDLRRLARHGAVSRQPHRPRPRFRGDVFGVWVPQMPVPLVATRRGPARTRSRAPRGSRRGEARRTSPAPASRRARPAPRRPPPRASRARARRSAGRAW